MTKEEKLSITISKAQYALGTINDICTMLIRNDIGGEDCEGLKATVELIQSYVTDVCKTIDVEEMEVARG